ncbi:hypothetical protein BGW38_009574, partial [Lunasporangiospora selenospora]
STYTILQFAMIFYLRLLHVQQRRIRSNPDLSILIRRTFGAALLAVIVWLIDLRLCEFVNGISPKSWLWFNPQLHAWWHLFSACALYQAIMLIAYYHYDVRGHYPVLRFWLGFIPILQLKVPPTPSSPTRSQPLQIRKGVLVE